MTKRQKDESSYRAPKGGVRGVNGEWYEGGQFLPASERTVKGAQKPRVGTGKKPVAPYVWEKPPAEDMLSIWDRVGFYVTTNQRDCEYVKGVGFVGLELRPADKESDCWKTRTDQVQRHYPHGYAYAFNQERYERLLPWVQELCRRFNEGERWYPLDEDPLHHKSKLVTQKPDTG